MHTRTLYALALASLFPGVLQAASGADQWRAEHRLIDLHHHVAHAPGQLARAVKIMDAAGIGIGVNLSGGTVTRHGDQPSAFERNRALSERLHPGRFLHYMNLDYAEWDQEEFSERAAAQVEDAHRLGAAGLKQGKQLGLYLKDGAGKLIEIDDPKLDAVWKKCGELNMPVSIHVADPKAFWLPFDETNERWEELKDHRSWWFGDPNVYPSREALLDARNRVIARHPKTTFVCVHFANNPEDIDAVDKWLDTYPNMMVDIAARVPELGRHDPEKVRRLFVKHQDRILFGTDFMVYDRLILGSGGSGPAPSDSDGVTFFEKHWRWMETDDKDFAHMTPIQGDWTINAIQLPADVLRKIYFDNARQLLARSLPTPRLRAKRTSADFAVDGDLSKPGWSGATPVWVEYQSATGQSKPALATEVRALWSDQYLYLAYTCPYTDLTVFEPKQEQERIGLWERDVVEAFLGTRQDRITEYLEFQVAPNGERLDLTLDLPQRDFPWSSKFETAVHIDETNKVWTAEMRIPMASITQETPSAGALWRLNLYRCDYANGGFMAWNPTLTKSFHTPERFGILELR